MAPQLELPVANAVPHLAPSKPPDPRSSKPGISKYSAIFQMQAGYEAKKWPADLIVIGSHGRRGFHHLLLGGGSEGVVRIATNPVLIIRGV